jgi:L-erythrulose 1-phosphate isomerase
VAFYIGTSWKMNKRRDEALAFARALSAQTLPSAVEVFVIPPFPYIADVAAALSGSTVRVGAQNMHWADAGAWTGEISPLMLKDCGATLVEIGHSERRENFGETDETVALKVAAAICHGLVPLVCIGEDRATFEAGKTAAILETQVRALVSQTRLEDRQRILIAYEPIWSIGEGGTPATPEFANAQHAMIKALARELGCGDTPVLYGGSVNRGNCQALARQPHLNGLFIGRAAWAVEGFLDIIGAASAARY